MKLLACLLASVLITTASQPAWAQSSDWAQKRFVYRAEGKKLADVFQDFAAAQGVPVVVAPGVDGSVTASFDNRSSEFLRAMGRTYGVIWYFDGVTLFVYPSNAMQSRVFSLRGFEPEQVRRAFNSFGLGDSRFPLRFNEAERTVLAYGPPRHIELVGIAVDTLAQGNGADGKVIRVMPLRYAIAADQVAGDVRIKGLASTLNAAVSAGAGATDQASDVARKVLGPGFGVADRREALNLTYGAKPQEGSTAGSPQRGGPQAPGAERPTAGAEDRPHFSADEATNSVIINASASRIDKYEALVRQLDVGQDMIEFEASIIDVSTDAFDSLGIQWDYSRAGGSRISLSPGVPGVASPNVANVLGGGAANITTLVADAGRNLLISIRALEGNGKARILARPKVIGSANRMATMVNKRIASVRVAGNLDANLFTIEAGTTLQVQPQIIAHPDHRDIKLTLYIQDGNFDSVTVDNIPIVKRTEIRTEAIIREGESLLVGGISVETDTSGRSGVPLLSRVPVLGALFRFDEKSTTRSERLFLLTPKVVRVNGQVDLSAAPAVPQSEAAVVSPPAASTNCAAGALGLKDANCQPKPAAPATTEPAPAPATPTPAVRP
jgi:type III secretion protein C